MVSTWDTATFSFEVFYVRMFVSCDYFLCHNVSQVLQGRLGSVPLNFDIHTQKVKYSPVLILNCWSEQLTTMFPVRLKWQEGTHSCVFQLRYTLILTFRMPVLPLFSSAVKMGNSSAVAEKVQKWPRMRKIKLTWNIEQTIENVVLRSFISSIALDVWSGFGLGHQYWKFTVKVITFSF